MATMNAQRTHKVEVVDEVKTRVSAATASIVSEYRGLSTSELAELRDALAAAGGDYRIFKNTLVRLAIEWRRVPAPVRVPQRPDRADLRAGRHQRRGQGPTGLLPQQPAPGDQGRVGRRVAPLTRRPGRPGRPAAPRGAPGPPGRRPRRADAADGRPPAGPAPQHGLRDLGADRAAPGRWGSAARRRRRPFGRGRRPGRRRGCSGGGRRSARRAGGARRLPPSRRRPPRRLRRNQRRRPPPKTPPSSTRSTPEPNHKTEAKKGRPGRWQP